MHFTSSTLVTISLTVVLTAWLILSASQIVSGAIRTSASEIDVNGVVPHSLSKLRVQPDGRVKRRLEDDQLVNSIDRRANEQGKASSDSTIKQTKPSNSRPAAGKDTVNTTSPTTASSPSTTTSTSTSSPSYPPSLEAAARQFKLVIQLLRAGKLEDCAGQVVCDLNCDPARYGRNGIRMAKMMTQVQRSGVMSVTDSSFLVTAGLTGRMYYWTSGCDRCKQVYSNCFTDSKSLMQLLSFIDLDHVKLSA